MFIFWKIRCFHRAEKIFMDRNLVLNTKTLEPIQKAAIELAIETMKGRANRDFLKYRTVFNEVDDAQLNEQSQADHDRFSTIFIEDYFEDEFSKEISLTEAVRIQTGNPNAVLLPSGASQHDVNLMFSEPKPLPIEAITLSNEQVEILAYFARDFRELNESAFMKDGPGTITSSGGMLTGNPVLETSVSDEEIRSFVTIFRRLYMAKEPANLLKAATIFTEVIGDYPKAKWVAAEVQEYENKLNSTCELRPFVQPDQFPFTRKRLIDVFIYTRYAHQPNPDRQRQYKECLDAVNGKKSLLDWIFLSELWKCALDIQNSGRQIVGWFERYCQFHKITPDILASLLHDSPGVGSAEKEADRRVRLFNEKVEELGVELWKRDGQPPGGPSQYFDLARQRLIEA